MYFCKAPVGVGLECGAAIPAPDAVCPVCNPGKAVEPMLPPPPPPATKPELVEAKAEELHPELETAIESPAAKKKHK